MQSIVSEHTKDFIYEDDLNYSIDGSYKGRFVNLGSTDVRIDDTLIKPTGSFNVDYSPFVAKGNVTIRFVAPTEAQTRNEDFIKNDFVAFYFGNLKQKDSTSC